MQGLRILWNTSVRTAGAPVEIKTDYLLDISLECYQYTNLLASMDQELCQLYLVLSNQNDNETKLTLRTLINEVSGLNLCFVS